MTDLSLTQAGALRGRGTPEELKLKKTTEQIEGHFVKEMFRAAKSQGGLQSDLLASSASDRFQELFEEAIGEYAAGNFGVGETLYRQLAQRTGEIA